MTVSLLKCPTWYGLRGLGRSPISRLTILIPVFGSLILFNTAVNDLVSLSAEFLKGETIDAALIERWTFFFNLYILYIGLMIFAVSTLAYNGFCPPVIREFRTEYDYYDAEQRIMTKSRAINLQKSVKEKFSEDLAFSFEITQNDGAAARALSFADKSTSENRESWLRAKSQPVSDLLQRHYALENESRKGSRLAIYAGYWIAFALIAWPSIVMFWKVLQTLT